MQHMPISHKISSKSKAWLRVTSWQTMPMMLYSSHRYRFICIYIQYICWEESAIAADDTSTGEDASACMTGYLIAMYEACFVSVRMKHGDESFAMISMISPYAVHELRVKINIL
jgi:hypothetical protein